MKSRHGLTLLEVLVAVAITGLLAMVASSGSRQNLDLYFREQARFQAAQEVTRAYKHLLMVGQHAGVPLAAGGNAGCYPPVPRPVPFNPNFANRPACIMVNNTDGIDCIVDYSPTGDGTQVVSARFLYDPASSTLTYSEGPPAAAVLTPKITYRNITSFTVCGYNEMNFQVNGPPPVGSAACPLQPAGVSAAYVNQVNAQNIAVGGTRYMCELTRFFRFQIEARPLDSTGLNFDTGIPPISLQGSFYNRNPLPVPEFSPTLAVTWSPSN